MQENIFMRIPIITYIACIYLLGLFMVWAGMASQVISVAHSNQSASYISLGLLAWNRHSIYLPLDAAQRISHVYGPLTFFPLGIVQWGGNPAAAAHLYGVIRGAIALVLFAAAIANISRSFSFAAIATVCIATFYGEEIWLYLQDGTIFLGLALFIFSFVTKNITIRIIIASIGIFIAVNTKITALLYFVPLLWLCQQYMEKRVFKSYLLFVIPMAIFLSVLLYTHPAFPLLAYFEVLVEVGTNRDIEFSRIVKNFLALIGAIMLLLAISWYFQVFTGLQKKFVAIAAISASPLLFYIAAKTGANTNHIQHFAVSAWVASAFILPQHSAVYIKKKKLIFMIVFVAIIALQENMWRRKLMPWLERDSALDSEVLMETHEIKKLLSSYPLYSSGYCNWVYKCPVVDNFDNSVTWIFRGVLHNTNYYHFIESTAHRYLDGALEYRGHKVPTEATLAMLRSEKIKIFVIPTPPGQWERKAAESEWAKIFANHYRLCWRGQHYELFCTADTVSPQT